MLAAERPDAFLVLGDTNSCISAVIAKRMRIPVFHMEAGNRSFDENVPEETNRRLVDHVSDYNLVYTEHARRNLLAEGIHPSRILLTGSPMREVLNQNAEQIAASDVLERQGLRRGEYFLVSLHREENVDSLDRLRAALESLQALRDEYGLPVLVSTHPRTRNRLESLDESAKDGTVFHPPFGFHDYIKLQQEAKLVLSDSGTISEEASILGFPRGDDARFHREAGVARRGRDHHHGSREAPVLSGVAMALGEPPRSIAAEYMIEDTAQRAVSFIIGSSHSHRRRAGLFLDQR